MLLLKRYLVCVEIWPPLTLFGKVLAYRIKYRDLGDDPHQQEVTSHFQVASVLSLSSFASPKSFVDPVQ